MIKKWIENEQCSKSIKTFLSFAQIKIIIIIIIKQQEQQEVAETKV